MTAILPPASHAQMEGELGYAYAFARQAILRQLQDEFNTMELGVVPLVGDFAGSGTDTLRITNWGDVGWGVQFADLANETDTITPSPIDVGYSTITVGLGGLSHSETYQDQILGLVGRGVDLDTIKALVPMSFLATHRSKIATVGSNFTIAVGAAGTPASVNDWLDMVSAFELVLGSKMPTVTFDPRQKVELKESFRDEPAFQAAFDGWRDMARFDGMQIKQDFAGSGITVAVTDDVIEAGGAYQGFAHSAGGIGWAVASTAGLKVANPNGAILIPQFGIVIEDVPGKGAQGQRQYEARTWVGYAAGADSVFTKRRFISKVV